MRAVNQQPAACRRWYGELRRRAVGVDQPHRAAAFDAACRLRLRRLGWSPTGASAEQWLYVAWSEALRRSAPVDDLRQELAPVLALVS